MKHYIRSIIFTKTPLNRKFRFKDEFQIYPLNLEKAPNSKNTNHFPLIIEYCYDDSDVPSIEEFNTSGVNEWISTSTAQINKLIKITNLLSIVTNYRFFFYRNPETFWAVPLPEERNERDSKTTKSFWAASMYYYPEITANSKINGLTENKTDIISLIPHKIYYWYEPVESKNKFIDFPEKIETIIEKYFALKDYDLQVADSCIFQISNGIELFSKMKSLSFFSIVSGIETLVNFEFRNEKYEYLCHDCKSLKSSSRKCEKCGSPIWGVTAKYRDFLFKYISDDPNAKRFYNDIYNIRSKITHTDYLINGENYLNWNFTDETNKINLRHLQALQLARRSFVYWILKK